MSATFLIVNYCEQYVKWSNTVTIKKIDIIIVYRKPFMTLI